VIALGAGLWLLGAVPGALASGATPPQPTDPKASSPAGTVYEIPLDAARSDAAPHRRASAPAGSAAGGGGGGGAAGGSGSSGGSSSGGSGGSGGSGSSGGSGTSGTSRASASATDPGSYVHSENGFGSSSQVPGLGRSAPEVRAATPAVLSDGGGSAPTGSIVLIGVVLLVGVYAGIFAGRRARA
jgi:phosphate transport system substrate-binding protein